MTDLGGPRPPSVSDPRGPRARCVPSAREPGRNPRPRPGPPEIGGGSVRRATRFRCRGRETETDDPRRARGPPASPRTVPRDPERERPVGGPTAGATGRDRGGHAGRRTGVPVSLGGQCAGGDARSGGDALAQVATPGTFAGRSRAAA